MKATVEFDDDLYRQLKATAAMRGKKVRELLAEGARLVLQSSWNPGKAKPRVELPLIRSSKKKPLKIPDDIAARLDRADDLERHAKSLRQ